MWPDVQNTYSMGAVGDYWITLTPFDDADNFGVSGEYGGTTAEFISDFKLKFGSLPKPLAALTIANLMSYYKVNQELKTINSTRIRDGIVAMEPLNTFAGIVYYGNNTQHTNPYFQYYPLQYIGGQTGKYLNSTADIIYPAPFHWLAKPKANTKLIVAIVVPVAVVIFISLIVGAMFIRRQRQQAVHALAKTEEGERRAYKIDFSSVEILDLIGSGSFGHVYRGTYRGADVAIKKLKHQNMDKKQLQEFTQEAAIMVGLRHPNILLFMGVCLEPAKLCIITELMSRGSLYDLLRDQNMEIPFNLSVRMAIDCLKGLQFIHSAGFVHRDLKSPNLLVDKSWNIKIADFGLSCGKQQASEEVQVSLLWTAPEILKLEKNCYTERSDMYSFAVILWELMSRQVPFTGVNAAAIHAAVVEGARPTIAPGWDTKVQRTIQMGWAPNPLDRISVKEAKVTLESITLDEFSMSATSSRSMGRYVGAPNPPCYFVFTEVESFVAMWEQEPHTMMRAMKIYHDVIHTLAKRCSGFKVSAEDDRFMIAFKDPVCAANFCLRTQVDLLRSEWPDASKLTAYREEYDEDGVVYKGPRVKMGIHYGNAALQNSDVSGKPIYNGPVINEGKRVTSCATGGQIFLTNSVYSAIVSEANQVDAFLVEPIGSFQFKGIKEPISIYELVPKMLKARLGSLSDALLGVKSGEEVKEVLQPKADQKWIIKYEDLTKGELIGIGASGDVHAGYYHNQQVAIKMFLNQKFTNDAIYEMRAESATLCVLEHPNIIDFKGMCITPPHICLVTELMSKGSLSTILAQAQAGTIQLPWPKKMNIAKDIASGLQYLHEHNIIHRDIKSGNVFISETWKTKIGDFGFSRVKAENQTMTQLGTVGWTSPEIFNGSHYTEKADIFGYAVLLWELIFMQKPWKGVHTMKVITMISAGQRLSLDNPPIGTPSMLLELIEKCWKQEPTDRPSSQEIVQFLQQTEY